MKRITKLVLVVALVASSTLSYAQCEKGKIMVGGESSLSFTSLSHKLKDDNGSVNDGSTTNIDFTPQVGYFIMDGLAVGLALPISYENDEAQNGNKDKTTTFIMAPFVRYYFGSSSLRPFVQGAVGFGSLTNKEERVGNPVVETKASIFMWDIAGGVAYFFNEHVSVDAALSYGSTSYKVKENNPNNTKYISSGFGFKVGFILEF